MKFYLLVLSLFAFVLSTPPKIPREISVTDTFIEIRQNLLECIVGTERASAELKKYARDFLATDLKGDLNLGQFRLNPVDNDVLKKCRREAFFNKNKPKKHN